MQATRRFGELTGIELLPDDGPRRAPILFVHGWWGGAWVWDRMMKRFAAKGHPCFAINLRGYHDSKSVADIGKVTFADHLEDIRYAVNVLGAPILITHSASGHLALKLSEERQLPAMVHLVPTPPAGFFSLRTMRVFARYLPRILAGKPVLLSRRDMFDADLNCLPPEEQESVYARMVPAPGAQGRQMLMVGVDKKKTRGPRLIISGSEDRLIPPRIHRAIARTYNAKYCEYPGRGHYLMREPGWDVIADDISAWLDETVQIDRKAAS
jgi:pimeloyl-ACP methyl ester carboxylesterase